MHRIPYQRSCLVFFSFFFFPRKADCHVQHFIWIDVWRLEAQLPYILLQTDLESLFRGASRGARLLIYLWPQNTHPLSGKVILYDPSTRLWEERTWSSEGGQGHLTSQISHSNPGDRCGDGYHRQRALTSLFSFLKPLKWKSVPQSV